VTQISHETLQLARQLIASRSITPTAGGCLSLVASRLSAAGFHKVALVTEFEQGSK